MSIHPNPMSMVAHAERRRQELHDQAQQYRLAEEASADAAQAPQGASQMGDVVAGRIRSLVSRLRPALPQPLELPQSTPGEAR